MTSRTLLRLQQFVRNTRIGKITIRVALIALFFIGIFYQFPPHDSGISLKNVSIDKAKTHTNQLIFGSTADSGSVKDEKEQQAQQLQFQKEGKQSESHPFFGNTIQMLLQNRPEGIPDLKLSEGDMKAPSLWYIDVPAEAFTIDFLSKYTEISPEQITELKKKHAAVKKDIIDLSYPENAYKGKGIVMIGGGDFLGTALTSILTLRDTGSKLPLELILTSFDEYQADVCEIMLPSLNARCVIMEEVLGVEVFKGLNLKKYELKVLGLFVSSFEEALLMDADNLAVKSPDYILESSVFNKFGYIIWMDFWRQTISPVFYQIADIEIGEPIRKDGIYPDRGFSPRSESQLADLEGAIPDSTCEAGQLAINKRTHLRPLLMTVYYNLLGFKYYYQLLGQGAVGIGDKDTFIAGLTVFGIKPYFVRHRPLLLGYNYGEDDNDWQDTTMVQYDPVQDFVYYDTAKDYMISQGIDSRLNIFLNVEESKKLKDEINEVNKQKQNPVPQVQFLHMHNPKFDAYANYKRNDYTIDNHPRRQFGARDKIKDSLDKDYELRFLAISEWLACESEIIPDNWKDLPRSEYCDAIKNHVQWLRDNSDTPDMGNVSFNKSFKSLHQDMD